jgi:hypothetical protein
MKKFPSLALSSLALALGLAACGTMSTIESRSQEQSATFAAASPREQNMMKRGLVAAGFTPNMVYVAIDKPDTITKSEDGRSERWIYKNFGQVPGSPVMGATKVTTINPSSAATARASNSQKNTYATRNDPSGPVDASQQHLVITFTDGKLTGMELLEM